MASEWMSENNNPSSTNHTKFNWKLATLFLIEWNIINAAYRYIHTATERVPKHLNTSIKSRVHRLHGQFIDYHTNTHTQVHAHSQTRVNEWEIARSINPLLSYFVCHTFVVCYCCDCFWHRQYIILTKAQILLHTQKERESYTHIQTYIWCSILYKWTMLLSLPAIPPSSALPPLPLPPSYNFVRV